MQTRQDIERKVVRHLIRTAKKHGYSLQRVWDGAEYVPTRTEAEALDAVFSVDESLIRFKHPEEDKAHCAVIVLGNSGWDAIADASMGERWDKVMDEAQDYADRFC
jgi:hypothetical protein